jgi:hypothetical protein
MLYVVEIRRGHDELSTIMARIQEWLAIEALHAARDGPVSMAVELEYERARRSSISSSRRNASRPRDSRDRTVPIGTAKISATSS